jgi:cytochrome d ubiquinol oxidase subunit I
MGTSLAFHIVFAALGVGLPLLVFAAEGMWLRTKDRAYYDLARSWAKGMAILFAIGAVSGTIHSFELGLLWPRFMGYAGGIIGLPFSLEGFAFFIEAIFIGLYLFGWDRLLPRVHGSPRCRSQSAARSRRCSLRWRTPGCRCRRVLRCSTER